MAYILRIYHRRGKCRGWGAGSSTGLRRWREAGAGERRGRRNRRAVGKPIQSVLLPAVWLLKFVGDMKTTRRIFQARVSTRQVGTGWPKASPRPKRHPYERQELDERLQITGVDMPQSVRSLTFLLPFPSSLFSSRTRWPNLMAGSLGGK